jgi:hypothetical protein
VTSSFVLPPLAPLRIAPTLYPHLTALGERALREPREAKRLLQVLAALRGCEASGFITSRSWRLDDPGRIHLHEAPIQGIPKDLRAHLLPPEGAVFISADWRSAHLTIAARWTGDALTSYEDFAQRLNVDRAVVKVVLLAFINGAGPEKIAQLAGRPGVEEALSAALPGVLQRREEARALHAAPGDTVMSPALSGAVRPVRKSPYGEGWRRLLAALWTRTEADAMAWVVEHLPKGVELAVPLFDGLLCCVREGSEEDGVAWLRWLMTEGARSAGVELGVKVGAGRTWAEAELTAQ